MSNDNLTIKLDNIVKSRETVHTGFWSSWPFIRDKTKIIANRNLVRLALHEFDRMMLLNSKFQTILEILLVRLRDIGELYVHNLSNATVDLKDEWDEVNTILDSKKSDVLQYINNTLDQDNQFKDLIYGAAEELINYIEENRTTLAKENSTNIKRHTYLYSKLADILGYEACELLYIQACLTILIGNANSTDITRIHDGRQTCDSYKADLYEALKKKDFRKARYIGYELASISEIITMWVASTISSHQISRQRYIKDEIKIESLRSELDYTIILKQCIADYAIGLYFYTATEKKLQSENRYASKLDYDRINEDKKLLLISELITNPQLYENKTISIRGVVTAINERKWFSHGHEAVSSEFGVTDGTSTIRARRYGRMFRDNGLSENEMIELSGVIKNDDGSYYININSINFNKTRKNSWLDRCNWLASRLWDNGTNKCACDWTLSTIDPPEPPQLSLGVYLCEEQDYQDALEEIVSKYPAAKALTGVFKELHNKVDNSYFKKRSRVTYFKSMCIDKILSSLYTITQEQGHE